MRLLAFSDLHCDRELAEKVVHESAGADVVIGAGDFGVRGERTVELFEIPREISVPLLVVLMGAKTILLAPVCYANLFGYLLDLAY